MPLTSVYLDMDGVLADFAGAISKAHGKPKYNGKSFNIAEQWGMPAKEFYKPCSSIGFWLAISKEPWADQLLAICQASKASLHIASSPTRASACRPGKAAWLKLEFCYARFSSLIFAKDKAIAAKPGSLLIDDKPSNVQAFIAAGGQGLLLPQPWNNAAGQTGPDAKFWAELKQCLHFAN